MSVSTVRAADPTVDRSAALIARSDLSQYSLGQILGLWAAAGAPMSSLAWVVAPWLADRPGGREPLGGALLICFNAGLIWMLLLTLVVIRRGQGTLESPRVRDALRASSGMLVFGTLAVGGVAALIHFDSRDGDGSKTSEGSD